MSDFRKEHVVAEVTGCCSKFKKSWACVLACQISTHANFSVKWKWGYKSPTELSVMIEKASFTARVNRYLKKQVRFSVVNCVLDYVTNRMKFL